MKLFTVLFAFLFSFAALAGGKILVEPYKIKDKDATSYKMGLSVDQKLFGALYYSGYIGNDWDKNADSEEMAIKNGLRLQVFNFAIEPGIQFAKTKGSTYTEEKYYVKASYQLW